MIDEIIRDIQNGIPWCMIFADDIILLDKSRLSVDQKLEWWRQILEEKDFSPSRFKIKYMKCDFSAIT
jgi:hypothetical protein